MRVLMQVQGGYAASAASKPGLGLGMRRASDRGGGLVRQGPRGGLAKSDAFVMVGSSEGAFV